MSLNGTVWAPIGPSPLKTGTEVNGQVTAIAVNPNNPNIIYIGTAWGGVWRTRDGGTTLDTDLRSTRRRSASASPARSRSIPIDTNIIYVGTSNRDGSQFSGDATQPPAGLFKSTDGGASWVRLGSGYPSSARAMRTSSSIRSSTSSSSIRPTTRSFTSRPTSDSFVPPTAA